MERAILAKLPSVTVIDRGEHDISRYLEILHSVIRDNWMLFYVETGVQASMMGDKVTFNFQYNRFYKDSERIISAARVLLTDVFNRSIAQCRTEYDVELAIFDHLLATVTYDESDNEAAHCFIGPLMYGKGVCEGIAEAFCFMGSCFGLDVACVSGVMDNEGHAWNIIKIGGTRYHVDVTSDIKGKTHFYLNCDDRFMRATHEYTAPTKCVSTAHNYLVMRNAYFRTVAEGERYMKAALSNNPVKLEMFIEEPLDYRDFSNIVSKYAHAPYDIVSNLSGGFMMTRHNTSSMFESLFSPADFARMISSGTGSNSGPKTFTSNKPASKSPSETASRSDSSRPAPKGFGNIFKK